MENDSEKFEEDGDKVQYFLWFKYYLFDLIFNNMEYCLLGCLVLLKFNIKHHVSFLLHAFQFSDYVLRFSSAPRPRISDNKEKNFRLSC